MKKLFTISIIISILFAINLNAKDNLNNVQFFNGIWIGQIIETKTPSHKTRGNNEKYQIEIFAHDSLIQIKISEGGNSKIDSVLFLITDMTNNLNRIGIYAKLMEDNNDTSFSDEENSLSIEFSKDKKEYILSSFQRYSFRSYYFDENGEPKFYDEPTYWSQKIKLIKKIK